MKTSLCLAVLLIPSAALAFESSDTIPQDQRMRFHNPDGSCVQCSLGMLGVDANVPAAEMLLWQSAYGPAERGGSTPTRVARYCQSRNIPILNITGRDTLAYIDAALDSGRCVGITWGSAHFIIAVSRDQAAYYVCDNRYPERIDRVDAATFQRNVRAYSTAGWCVVLKGPKPLPWKAPPVVAWWDNLP